MGGAGNQGESDRPLPAGAGGARCQRSTSPTHPLGPSLPPLILPGSVSVSPRPPSALSSVSGRAALLTVGPTWLPPLPPLPRALAISADSARPGAPGWPCHWRARDKGDSLGAQHCSALPTSLCRLSSHFWFLLYLQVKQMAVVTSWDLWDP